MAGSALNLQAQVESVLGELVKVATVELTKLFESRYRASAVDVGHGEELQDVEAQKSPERVSSLRSIGVQVDRDNMSAPSAICDSCSLSLGNDNVENFKEEEEEETGEEGSPTSTGVLLAEDNDDVDPCGSPLKEKDVGDIVDKMEGNTPEAKSPAVSDSKTETVLLDLRSGSPHSSPTKRKLRVIQPDTIDAASGNNIKFVCPLILKADSPVPRSESSEELVHVEPQHSSASTAYSPSTPDGAVSPAQVGIWERIHTATETKNNLHLKLKLTSPDKKLMRPCVVHLVNLLAVPRLGPGTDVAKTNGAQRTTGLPLPKDLRPHQGLHTGHRLCCFTQCENGVWRLQNIVSHSRDGYACTICAKKFERRKTLRRHERFHTGEKPYSCSQCPKTFALRKSLRRHQRFHTGERPHRCTQCGKSFRLRENLKAHLRFHSGDKPFNCSLCGKTFRISRNLEKHNLSQCGTFVPSFRTIAGF
ncbi:uncharacterized protein LOC143010193 isoform X2 [Genypterus blacodes]